MTALLVDLDSVTDMRSALVQLAALVRSLDCTASRAAPGDPRVRHSDLPQGSTVQFADDLWALAGASTVVAVIEAIVRVAGAHAAVSFNEIYLELDLFEEDIVASMNSLDRIEEHLGATLLGVSWVDGDRCDDCTLHPVVRQRLAAHLQSIGRSG